MYINNAKKVCKVDCLTIRGSRFYVTNKEWYFSIREEKDKGPYPTKEYAVKALENFLKDIKQINVQQNTGVFRTLAIV